MSSVLNDCQEVKSCICCVPLRTGCILIALAGIILGILGLSSTVLLLTSEGSHAESVGLSGDLGNIVLLIFSVTNVLLPVASIFLLTGACKRIKTFVTIYVWLLILYLFASIVVVLFALKSCFSGDKIQSGVTFLFGWALLALLLLHFLLVANSYRMRLV